MLLTFRLVFRFDFLSNCSQMILIEVTYSIDNINKAYLWLPTEQIPCSFDIRPTLLWVILHFRKISYFAFTACNNYSRLKFRHTIIPTRFFIISAKFRIGCSSGLPKLTGSVTLEFINVIRPSTKSDTY